MDLVSLPVFLPLVLALAALEHTPLTVTSQALQALAVPTCHNQIPFGLGTLTPPLTPIFQTVQLSFTDQIPQHILVPSFAPLMVVRTRHQQIWIFWLALADLPVGKLKILYCA
jgi:hypothetical protein